jgi:transposase
VCVLSADPPAVPPINQEGRTIMAEETLRVFGGVDTHKDVHVAAVVDERGKILDTASFDANAKGYAALRRWLEGFGTLVRVGVEGTGSYGTGLTRHLQESGVEVVEVNRPNRQMRRQRGKSDPVDAEAAARAALNGEATIVPKDHDDIVESIRVLRIAFCSARDTRTRLALQIRDLIVTAPAVLRESMPEKTADRVAHCAKFRPGNVRDPHEATRLALKTLSRRYQELSDEIVDLTKLLDELTREANPALRAAKGVGVDVASILLVAAGTNCQRLRNESAFAALCGVSPIQASSGQTNRHRLNRSGNRQANNALWRIAMVRMTTDEETRTYLAKRTAEGKTKRDVTRCLKRHLAREVFWLLQHPVYDEIGPQLRTTRTSAHISLRTVSDDLGVWPTKISRIERGLEHDPEFVAIYQAWLSAHPAA